MNDFYDNFVNLLFMDKKNKILKLLNDKNNFITIKKMKFEKYIWDEISKLNLSDLFIVSFKNDLNFELLSKESNISYYIILKFKNKINFELLSNNKYIRKKITNINNIETLKLKILHSYNFNRGKKYLFIYLDDEIKKKNSRQIKYIFDYILKKLNLSTNVKNLTEYELKIIRNNKIILSFIFFIGFVLLLFSSRIKLFLDNIIF